MSESRDGDGRPEPAPSVPELDSAATTLLPSAKSSKGASADLQEHEVTGSADVASERWATGDMVKRRGGSEAIPGRDNEEDADTNDPREDEGLLVQNAADLNRNRQAAATIPDAADPPPLSPSMETASTTGEKPKAVSWMELPKKGQLAILTLARMSEPLTQTSLQAYMFYQLKSFKNAEGETPSDSTVAMQAGMLAAAFTGAQFCTAIMWGRLADWEGMGRKRVLLIGLLGTALGSLGFGFSQSFPVAMFWRMVGGMLNGNMGVMRTMVSEMIQNKRFQSRAFLLLPMTSNIGMIIGPILGGILADPVGSYPALFGPNSTFGGQNGVWLFTKWPYALPNMVNAIFLTIGSLALFLGLDETLEGLRGRSDWGTSTRRWISRTIFRRRPRPHDYTAIDDQESSSDIEVGVAPKDKPRPRRRLPFRQIWTRNVILNFISHGMFAMHVGTFANLWFIFLSTPRYDPAASADTSDLVKLYGLPGDYRPRLPFVFTGGLALPPPSIGTALAILGVIGIVLQFFLYPPLSFILGNVRSYRAAMLFFPIAYCIAPFLAILPSTRPPPHQASGALIWIGITAVLTIQVLARTFALPAAAILINNCCPHPTVLGTVHGFAQSVSAATRTIGPILMAWIYGIGLEKGVVGMAWWSMGAIAVVGAFAAQFVKEGDGHEIWLPGEKDEVQREVQ